MAAPKSVASLDFISKFAEHADSRDKVAKTLQFLSKFLVHFARRSENAQLAKQLQSSFLVLRDYRKLPRLGRYLDEIRGVFKLSQLAMNPVRIFRIGRKLGFIVYYFFDNVTILARITILPSTLEQRMKWILWATLGWAFSVVSNILAITTALIINTREESSLPSDPSRHEDLERIRKNRRTLLIQLLGALGDATIVFSALRVPQMLVRRRLSDAWVGLGGMTSAIATGYLLARRVARKHGFEMKYVVSPVYRGPGS